MHTIEKINKIIYIDKHDYDYMKKYEKDDVASMYPKKTRGINIHGVMKNSECYHITLDEEYLKHIKEKYKSGTPNRFDHQAIYIKQIIEDLFPGELMFVHSLTTHHPVTTISSSSKYNIYDRDENVLKDTYTGTTFEFDIWYMKDWIECPKNKAELAKIKEIEERKAVEKLNIACLKDTIVAALEQAGIKTAFVPAGNSRYGDRAYIKADNKTEWNKIVLLGINSYLNNIAKEHGFKVTMPNIKKNAKLNEYTPFFFLDNIEIVNEGE